MLKVQVDTDRMIATKEKTATTDSGVTCYHCGEDCANSVVALNDLSFCCDGCRIVYQLLSENNLDQYYRLNDRPGIGMTSGKETERFAYLDNEEIRSRLLDFSDDSTSRITLTVPQVHCSSCVWLLENLYRLQPAIGQSRVDFLRKELSLSFEHNKISLRQLVELLSSLGYEPEFNLSAVDPKQRKKGSGTLYRKVGIAGFCFANIMLLSFPDYLTSGGTIEPQLKTFFGYLSILLSLPVLLYCSSDYFKSAFLGIRRWMIVIDLPIAIGITMLFGRSVWEILAGTGTGYLDSLAGLLFFLLLGKVFQQKTFDSMSFDRDYRSYFPISVTKVEGEQRSSVAVMELKRGDRILIRNQELIPADAKAVTNGGLIDYSFVTGESTPASIAEGATIFAGGKQVGQAIEVEVLREVSQSYLTQLWNNARFSRNEPTLSRRLADVVGKYFTLTILGIALATFLYWLPRDIATAINAATAVLIIACPCALALASPFALGTALRIMGRNHLFLKNDFVIEELYRIDTIVFDKTGTLTVGGEADIEWFGEPLSDSEQTMIKSLVMHSAHPLSRGLVRYFESISSAPVEEFAETTGEGLSGLVGDHQITMGQRSWILDKPHTNEDIISESPETEVWLAIDGVERGKFVLRSRYRKGISGIVGELSKTFKTAVISGDSDKDRGYLEQIFGTEADLRFRQSPHDKLEYIERLRAAGNRVMMIGDGLNDAGALKAGNAGISITDSISGFSPACDGILDSAGLSQLPRLMSLVKKTVTVIGFSFGISFLYNGVGLWFAVSGQLSPLVAAILMPLSSITIVLFSTLATTYAARSERLV